MEQVCLMKAGNFLLGLNTSNIISTLSLDDLRNNKSNGNDFTFLIIGSFLAQKDIDSAYHEIIVLKNKNNKKHWALMVEKKIGEIKPPGQFVPYPQLYPELAKKCCPKIFLHKDQIVLLLDPKQLSIIHKKLHTDYGLISFADLMHVKETIEQKTISSIVSWIFEKYNKFYGSEKLIKLYSNEKIIISVKELPSSLVQQQVLSNGSIQQLINKTIRQCEKIRYKTMKNMIIDKLDEI